MKQSDMDSSFEKYRRDRTFRRLQNAADQKADSNASSVLRQLEAAERSEVRSETLSREVHDFFADATRTAAGIVQHISETHEERAGQRVHHEIEDFLHDVIRRAEVFMTALQLNREPGAQQTEMEATVRNIVGHQLDEFRAEGTAQLNDKHFGQDPFITPATDAEEPAAAPTSSESHPSALEWPEPPTPVARGDLPEPNPEWVRTEEYGDSALAPKPIEQLSPGFSAYPAPPEPLPAPVVAATQPTPAGSEVTPLPGLPKDPAKLRATLKALVKTGVMGREDAQAMYRSLMSRK